MSEQDSEGTVNLVIGTAGHIDHGKSSLVHRLTGKHPSRLKEEIERGMTIDIGFSEWKISERMTAGIIDVPGHERFVRNMVAGAAGIDLVLLVVAADDGVMQQTREHLHILRLLGIPMGLTVVTKIDAVDRDLLEIVLEDLRGFLHGTFLEAAPIVPVSNVTGEGIDGLRATILDMLAKVPRRSFEGVFRMPINRSFSVKGHGTVVTGVPVSGRIGLGDELEILPKSIPVRVRGIQVHHHPAEAAQAGHRTAINVTDAAYKDIRRGDVVAARGFFTSSTLLEARLEYLDIFEKPLASGANVRFHSGTADVGGKVVLLDKESLLPGEDGLVQIRLEEPVVVAAGDRYIVRLASPVVTLGGGVVVGETRRRFKRFREWLNQNIEQKEAHLGDPIGYLEYVVRSQGTTAADIEEIAKGVKEDVPAVRERLKVLHGEGAVRDLGRERFWIHQDMFDRAVVETSQALLELHKSERLQAGFHLTQLTKATKFSTELVEAVVQELVQRKKVEVLDQKLVRHREWTGGLSQEDYKVVTKIADMHAAEPFGAPIFSEIVAAVGKAEKKVKELVTYLVQMGKLVPIAPDLALDVGAVAQAERLLVLRIKKGGPMPSAEFKDVINASRKYVIPLLEYFDKKGITKRQGNERVLTPGWEKFALPSTLEAASAV